MSIIFISSSIKVSGRDVCWQLTLCLFLWYSVLFLHFVLKINIYLY